MSRKICLLTDHHISLNPRLWKEAFFYEKQGWQVVILTMWMSSELLAMDQELLHQHEISYRPFIDMRPGKLGLLSRLVYQIRKMIAATLQKRLGLGTPWAISYAPELLYRFALREDADLYSAHLECGFLAGRKLIKANKKVSFDFEDWYSRDYLVPARPVGLLRSLELFAVRRGLFCTTTSLAMAEALELTYQPGNKISIIYNGFPVTRSQPKQQPGTDNQSISLVWFSRTIGPGRGLENLIAALQFVNSSTELHLIGNMKAGFLEFLQSEFKRLTKHSVCIHPFVAPEQLPAFLTKFDIGLALEQNTSDNKSLTISNKILQYLQAGLPVIATPTLGQKEVASYFPAAVRIIDIAEHGRLEKAIIGIREKPLDQLQQLEQFNKVFSWEAQEKKLEEIVTRYFPGTTGKTDSLSRKITRENVIE